MLMEEHVVILNALLEIESLLQKDIADVTDQLFFYFDFIQEYSDDYHHGKEEGIYFKWMAENDESLKNGPIHCMTREHDQFRALTQQSKKNLLAYLDCPEDKTAQKSYQENCYNLMESFISSLRNHIQKEDQILYQMAERLNLEVGDGDQIMLDQFYELNENMRYIPKKFSKLIKAS
jgi:hemerythrin-like domain-containing protein